MTPEEKELLNETYNIAKENNSILKSIRLGNRISTGIRVLYWVVIIGLSFGAYYFIQPYINILTGLLGTQGVNVGNIENITKGLDTLLK